MPSTQRFGAHERDAVNAVITSGLLWRGNGASWTSGQGVGGVTVDCLEDRFSTWLGVPYVLAVNSGSSANEAMIASLGLTPGDEIICPAASPIFVPLAVLALGCIPVFADVDPETLLMDPRKLEGVISQRTRAVVAVHLWGLPAPMREISRIAQRFDLRVVEDCAQALATSVDGHRVGTFGDAACFSLQQSKLITAGEGGLLSTRSSGGYARAVLYSNSGIPSFRYGATLADAGVEAGLAVFGHNHRMSELQAAVALAQLERIDGVITRRAHLVRVIEGALADLEDTKIRIPATPETSSVSYWRYPVIVEQGRGNYVGIPQLEPIFRRMELERVTPLGIPLPDHVHYGPAHCPMALLGANQIRVIPIEPTLSDDEVRATVRKAMD